VLFSEDQPLLTSFSRELFASLYEELCTLDERIETMETRIQRVFSTSERCQKIAAIEGIAPVTATAIVAAVAEASAFRNGRQLAAWLGLVPRQHSSGEKQRLLGITKRGDPYLRTLLIHGARSVVYRASGKTDSRSHGSRTSRGSSAPRRRVWLWRTRTRESSGLYWPRMSHTGWRSSRLM
jgi:transposase